MKFDLSTLAYAARVECAAAGYPIQLGHAQELFAAAVGCRTFASLQAAAKSSDYIGHVLLDERLLAARAMELGYAGSGWAEPILKALKKHLPADRVHETLDSFFTALYTFVDDRAINDPDVISQTTMTNGWLGEVYMPLYLEGHEPFEEGSASFDPMDHSEDDFSFNITGHVTMEQDPNKPSWGHKVNVDATLTFSRLGGCLFTVPELKVTHAKLQWGGLDEDEYDRPTRRDLAHVLTEKLGLTEEEAAVLEYDHSYNESKDGLAYSEILEIAPTNDSAVLKKIQAKHGTLSVHVWPGFFDDVKMEK